MACGGSSLNMPSRAVDEQTDSREQYKTSSLRSTDSSEQISRSAADLEAIENHRKDLKSQIINFGEDDLRVADTRKVIGKLYSKIGMHKEARDMILIAVNTYENCGADEKQVWQCHDILAKCYNKLNDKAREIEHYEKAIHLIQRARKGKSPVEKLAHLHYNIASAYKKSADQNNTDAKLHIIREHLEEAKNIMKVLGRDQSETMVLIHLTLGQVYTDLDWKKQAIDELETSISVSQKTHPSRKDESKRKSARKTLSTLYEVIGENGKAEEHKRSLQRSSNRSSTGTSRQTSQVGTDALRSSRRKEVLRDEVDESDTSTFGEMTLIAPDQNTGVAAIGHPESAKFEEAPIASSQNSLGSGHLTIHPPARTFDQNLANGNNDSSIMQNESATSQLTGEGAHVYDYHSGSTIPSNPGEQSFDLSQTNPEVTNSDGDQIATTPNDSIMGHNVVDEREANISGENTLISPDQNTEVAAIGHPESAEFEETQRASAQNSSSSGPLTLHPPAHTFDQNLTTGNNDNSMVQNESATSHLTGEGVHAYDYHSGPTMPFNPGEQSRDLPQADLERTSSERDQLVAVPNNVMMVQNEVFPPHNRELVEVLREETGSTPEGDTTGARDASLRSSSAERVGPPEREEPAVGGHTTGVEDRTEVGNTTAGGAIAERSDMVEGGNTAEGGDAAEGGNTAEGYKSTNYEERLQVVQQLSLTGTTDDQSADRAQRQTSKSNIQDLTRAHAEENPNTLTAQSNEAEENPNTSTAQSNEKAVVEAEVNRNIQQIQGLLPHGLTASTLSEMTRMAKITTELLDILKRNVQAQQSPPSSSLHSLPIHTRSRNESNNSANKNHASNAQDNFEEVDSHEDHSEQLEQEDLGDHGNH